MRLMPRWRWHWLEQTIPICRNGLVLRSSDHDGAGEKRGRNRRKRHTSDSVRLSGRCKQRIWAIQQLYARALAHDTLPLPRVQLYEEEDLLVPGRVGGGTVESLIATSDAFPRGATIKEAKTWYAGRVPTAELASTLMGHYNEADVAAWLAETCPGSPEAILRAILGGGYAELRMVQMLADVHGDEDAGFGLLQGAIVGAYTDITALFYEQEGACRLANGTLKTLIK